MRLSIAAQEEYWLTEKKYQALFFHLDESLQNRLIRLMSMNQCALFYKIAQENNAPFSIINQLRRNAADHLGEQIRFLKKHQGQVSFSSLHQQKKTSNGYFPVMNIMILQIFILLHMKK